MRAIQKQGTGGFHLAQAHVNPPQTPDQATSRWGSFNHKPTVMQHLLDEQYYLCCYSELRADQEGLGYHIEHVENKSQNPLRTFDYGNLAASALHSGDLGTAAFKGRHTEVFGGHAAGKTGSQGPVNMQNFIHPHRADCRRFFSYLSDGRVVPANGLSNVERGQTQYTIDILNLNSPFLVTRRQQWWDELDKLYQEHVAKGWSLHDLVAVDLVPTHGRLSRFFSLTRQFFGVVAEQTLQQQAPALV
ncbi:TIGR02646 family protein [Burkholderia multivorans]|uniref:retron system putative HNH endonuclease n=1 Tax=Burkholderia multivorans TaxID=87883 RepID=UPI001C2407B1|nr:retron system putative HNH endonuclease [Burkholderia multivorans]MBU9420502.1 TIGR02646 family protein [Burkholderia multivorans]HCF3691195.1 TIGR02646 family protein [Pseudomonas aeruginosa]